VALPSIRHDIGGGVTGLQWVVDGYTLMFAALLLSCGALTDRLGARRAMTTGMSVFVAASAACGLSPGLAVLVLARFVQGTAAALMVPASMALIREAFDDPSERRKAVALWAVGGAVASSAGPVLGGLLTVVSWRAIFFVNLPVGVMAILLLARADRSPERPAPIDWAGQITAVAAMGGLTYGAIEAGVHGLTSPPVVTAFAIAVVGLMAFVVSQSKGKHPMVPPSLVRSRNLSVGATIGFAFMVGYYGLPFVMSLYLQERRGLSALATGVAFLPMMLSGAALTPFTARLIERVGARRLITRGLAMMAAGLCLLAIVAVDLPVWGVALVMALVGVTGPMVMPPATSVLLDSVPSAQTGTASGVFNTSRQLGGALAVAVFGTLLARPATFVVGVRISLLMAAVVALAAASVALLLRHTTEKAVPVSLEHIA
jgi:EmrB/QacA subfamily drug resistance transporter